MPEDSGAARAPLSRAGSYPGFDQNDLPVFQGSAWGHQLWMTPQHRREPALRGLAREDHLACLVAFDHGCVSGEIEVVRGPGRFVAACASCQLRLDGRVG